jgi:putative peptidoglycan lipid II flippase
LAAPDAAKRFALHVEPGTAAALFYSQRMYQFPLGLIGVAMATVLYPVLSSHAAAKKFDDLRDDLTHGLQVALSVAIPASGGLAVLAGPITKALFQHGKFTAADAALTSRIMGIYASAVWAAVGLMLVQRGFFASGDRKTPLKTGLAAVGVNMALIAICVSMAGGKGLAAASAMTAIFHFGLSLLLLRTHIVAIDWARLGWTVLKTAVATALMVGACLGVERRFQDVSGRWTLLLMLLGTGAATFLMAAQYLKLKEHWELILPKRNRPGMPLPNETVSVVLDSETADLPIENPR